ncbi:glycogen debranching protein GlgX [Rhodoblastus acidophilus]|uniref:4-alpha-glucanotransferase n=1 Tax=Candidatus Rhodoblastus alkanivorans TaxID=2954117 RepID=A0ABS9Z8W5_9HYPH|nr:glycogen debranching protein GlgX [Candidatus Rhodoblastus alkanivorans]MCI4678713.1 glycogen debranching protein GlgX [Candidatus Rhodoblastus alkanivorans]MCI4683491.1 glycogen debranching protein GlgX [Candidatus Rhodoblastus alkanivorans]MDI4640805.1 glycogen debranching protein GlgX [Rhodoblastus acidophilus]
MIPHALLPGSPEPLGLSLAGGGANIAVFSETAHQIDLCLFDASGRFELARLALPGRTGPIFHGFVPGMSAGALYGLRAHGPWRPEEGLRFNANKLLLDPFALAIDRPARLHDSLFDFDSDSGPFAPKAIAAAPPFARPNRPKIPWSETIIYELHARGFTRALGSLPEKARGTFAGLAHPAAIAHLKLLGVTTLELMPCAASIDERHLRDAGLTNYWGYNPIAFRAPDPRLAPGGWREVRESVATLQDAGFEVLIDVVLNHSGESDAGGPTLSLRGLDNAVYYRLDPADAALYVNDAGCGNILRFDHPAPLRLAMDALRAWALYGGVDGFRFDLATTLARRPEGFDPHAPLLAAIAQDPVLRDLKLIAEPWDIGSGGYQIGRFPPLWGEWNDAFRDAARKFWRGDSGMIGEMATRIAGSSDLFAGRKPPTRSVNFVTAHDGFTLADLVAFERKHNEANGEDNRDGTDANHSWNNGAEGETADERILAARRRDQRNLLAALLLSRGAPMLSMGAELGQSQRGNNNAYAQDNETAWLDWSRADGRLIAFARALIALRKTTPALTQDRFLTGAAPDGHEHADVEWRGDDGEILTPAQWRDDERRFLGAFFAADGSRAGVLFNAGGHGAHFRLPQPRENHFWRRALDTQAEDGAGDGASFDCGETLIVAPRSTLVLIETPDGPANDLAPSPETLDALARAAGIAPDWHDIKGERHIVPDATKAALLKAMGLPAATQAESRASLKRLADERDRRALPFALVAREGEAIEAPLVFAGPRAELDIEDESGARRRLALGAESLRREQRRACDGLVFAVHVATLPPLPIGRYKLMLADEPGLSCALTVAPPACYWPPGLDARVSGLSTQLYSLRRDGDQGIGDFTSLAELAEAAGRAGYAAVGINPLHALFARDRDRASPYYPSDRNFLDSIYLDLETLGEITGLPCALEPDERERAKALATKNEVDYPAVWALKAGKITSLFAAFEEAAKRDPSLPAARDFEAFIAEGGERLFLFAAFEAEARQGKAPVRGEAIRAICFEQWLCDRQIARAAARAKAAGLSLGFYRDLAVGAAPDGGEVWAERELFLHGVSVGAPPDPFAEGGQNWGLPPPDSLKMARMGYAAFAQLLRANMRHAGALRIDHVMALTRLFVVPEGASALEGAYLAFPLDDLLGQLALESHRAQCLVVGEDLGTVPAGFRDRMAAANVLSYRVLWFERHGEDFAPPSAYPHGAVACASTHDLPTLAGWRRGADIEEKAALGLVSPEEAARERTRRDDDISRLLKALAAEHLAPANAESDADFAAAIHAFVAKTPSVLAMIQIDDLLGETVAVNLPGTDRERPNWRRRFSREVGALAPLPRN